ncbi:MAG TPA: response regulator [Vicinamibacterales bacterium]|jgi:two-component system nitrogen regulation response regulator GlnG
MALVLVVDDETHVRELLGQAIRKSGHEVIEADSSASALKAMVQRPADVVFTDIQMPGRDGRWLTVQLRKLYPLTAIVLATSVTDLSSTITLRFGVLSYLIKPFDLPAVREALRRAIEWHDNVVTSGPEAVEQERLEEWLDSLEIV